MTIYLSKIDAAKIKNEAGTKEKLIRNRLRLCINFLILYQLAVRIQRRNAELPRGARDNAFAFPAGSYVTVTAFRYEENIAL